jgi:co-chaperonin GroES (HSP10)
MGSGISVTVADAHACKGDAAQEGEVLAVGHGKKPAAGDKGQAKSAEAHDTYAGAQGDESKFKAGAEAFMKLSLSTNLDINSIKVFLSNPASMQLYKMFLKMKMNTPDALSLLTVSLDASR